MSRILRSSFKLLGKGALYLGRGYVLKKEEGARFSTKQETKKIFSSRHKGLVIDGANRRISEKSSLAHVAVIAKSGFGKTTTFIIPNIIDRIKKGNSVVVLDPSRELFEKTSSLAKKHNYKVLLLDPTDADQMQFNPYYDYTYENLSDIRSVSASLVLSKYGSDKDPIWNDGAISLIFFFAKCLAYRKEVITIPKIYSLLLKFGSDGRALDKWVSQVDHPEDVNDESIRDEWKGLVDTQEGMLASYSSIAKTALSSLSEDVVKQVLSGNDVNFLSFRTRRTILYLSFPSHKQKDYQFIIDVFYSRLFADFMSVKPKNSDITLYCLLDEFGSSYIKDFQMIATNIRKYKVSLSIVMQSIAQLRSRYGLNAEEIKGGIGSYVVFAGADSLTAGEISKSIGTQTLIERNAYTDIVKHRSRQDLLSPDAIRTLEDNQVVFLSGNKYAVVLDTVPYYKNSSLSRLVK